VVVLEEDLDLPAVDLHRLAVVAVLPVQILAEVERVLADGRGAGERRVVAVTPVVSPVVGGPGCPLELPPPEVSPPEPVSEPEPDVSVPPVVSVPVPVVVPVPVSVPVPIVVPPVSVVVPPRPLVSVPVVVPSLVGRPVVSVPVPMATPVALVWTFSYCPQDTARNANATRVTKPRRRLELVLIIACASSF
jgi:hypothetical protein